MSQPLEDREPTLPGPGAAGAFRAVFAGAGYSEASIQARLQLTDWPMARARFAALPLHLERTRGATPLDALIRLFLLGQPAPLEAVRRAVAPMALGDWIDAGLLGVASGAAVAAKVELTPYGDLIVAADWPARTLDQVMCIAPSSRALAQMTLRRPVKRTLDLGAGCGIQALLAAAHSEEVVAVDANPRAVAFARFNARLNGLTNITCLTGNLFEPVQGQVFDLIVCNPPFVIGPDMGCLHTCAGLPGDQFCRDLVRAAPEYLREGGFGQILCNWRRVRGEDWKARLAAWLESSGCDAWALQARTEEASFYAFQRIRERVEDDEEVARHFDEWMAHYRREGTEAIDFGLITLRRSDRQEHWLRCDAMPEVRGACGEAIGRGFDLRDFLEAHRDDPALLHARLRRADHLEWRQKRSISDKGWSLDDAGLRLADGLSYGAPADQDLLDLLTRCDGQLPLDHYLNTLAKAKKRAAPSLAAEFLRVVRQLVALGFLLPAEYWQ